LSTDKADSHPTSASDPVDATRKPKIGALTIMAAGALLASDAALAAGPLGPGAAPAPVATPKPPPPAPPAVVLQPQSPLPAPNALTFTIVGQDAPTKAAPSEKKNDPLTINGQNAPAKTAPSEPKGSALSATPGGRP
jgi:hypothetical protein